MRSPRASELISRFAEAHVAVVGDLILDRYVWGRASRISPEAPVPVVQVRRESHSLGGAANVLLNLVSLGAGAHAFGVVGDDDAGSRVRELCAEAGVCDSGIIADRSRQTTVKTRDRTGVEMEALVAASTAALTVYDMCKAIDRDITIEEVQLQEKTGGRSGHYVRTAK